MWIERFAVCTVKEIVVPMISVVKKNGHDLNVAAKIDRLKVVEGNAGKICYLQFKIILLNEN